MLDIRVCILEEYNILIGAVKSQTVIMLYAILEFRLSLLRYKSDNFFNYLFKS